MWSDENQDETEHLQRIPADAANHYNEEDAEQSPSHLKNNIKTTTTTTTHTRKVNEFRVREQNVNEEGDDENSQYGGSSGRGNQSNNWNTNIQQRSQNINEKNNDDDDDDEEEDEEEALNHSDHLILESVSARKSYQTSGGQMISERQQRNSAGSASGFDVVVENNKERSASNSSRQMMSNNLNRGENGGNLANEIRVSSLSQGIMEPLKLKILILSGTAIGGRELLSIHPCVNLLKLDLSSNQIRQFPRGLSFASLKQLRLLFLHNNLIDDVETLYKIFEIPKLTYLTLFQNPLSSKWSLRHFIVNSMPSLFAFDFNAIADEERMPQVVRTERFFALSPLTKLNWPLLESTKQVGTKSKSNEWYLNCMHEEISLITHRFTLNSPCVIIQRMFRGFSCRKQVKERVRFAEERLQLSEQVSSNWKKHTSKKTQLKQLLEDRGKEYLLFDNNQYRLCRGKDKLRQVLRQYLQKARAQHKWKTAARVIIKAMHRMRNFLSSYQKALFSNYLSYQTKEADLLPKTVTIYFHRDSLPVFYEILDFMQRYVSESELATYYELLQSNRPKPARDLLAIRVPQSNHSTNHQFTSKYPFNAMMRPSLRSKILLARPGQKYYDTNNASSHPFFARFRAQVTLPNMDVRLARYRMSKFELAKYHFVGEKITKFQQESYECLMEITMDSGLAHAFTKSVFSYNYQQAMKQQSSTAKPLQTNQNPQFLTEVANQSPKKNISSSQSRKISQEQQQYTQQQQQLEEDNGEGEVESEKNGLPFFLIFFHSYMTQVSAAIRIQKVWRSYATRNIQPKVFHMIQRKRACMKIQYWIRDMRFRHRRCFMCMASAYLSSFTTTTVYIHFTTYANLNSIFAKTQANFTMTFFEQSSLVSFNPAKGTVRLQWDFNNPESATAIANKQQVFPQWLKLGENLKPHEDQYIGDMMHVLNVGTKTSLLEMAGMKFVKITFESLSELKYRAAALALLSYRFRNPRFFIKLYSLAQIQSYSYILTEETDLKLTYNIDLPYDNRKCLSQVEYSINNPRSLFLSSMSKKSFNERCEKVQCVSAVTDITFYREDRLFSIGGGSSSRATRPSMKATAIGNPVKLSATISVFYMASMYFLDIPRVFVAEKDRIIASIFQPMDESGILRAGDAVPQNSSTILAHGRMSASGTGTTASVSATAASKFLRRNQMTRGKPAQQKAANSSVSREASANKQSRDPSNQQMKYLVAETTATIEDSIDQQQLKELEEKSTKGDQVLETDHPMTISINDERISSALEGRGETEGNVETEIGEGAANAIPTNNRVEDTIGNKSSLGGERPAVVEDQHQHQHEKKTLTIVSTNLKTNQSADESSLASRFLKNTIVSRDLTQPDTEILKHHKNNIQSLLKEREDESLRVRQQSNYNYSMRSHLLARAFAFEAEMQLQQEEMQALAAAQQFNDVPQQLPIKRSNQRTTHGSSSYDVIGDIELKLQRVEVLKEIGMKTKNDGQWAENFHRSENYLSRQMAAFRKGQAKEAIIERNIKRANKVREKKLLSASHMPTPMMSNRSQSNVTSASSGNANGYLPDSYYSLRTEAAITPIAVSDAYSGNRPQTFGVNRIEQLQQQQHIQQLLPALASSNNYSLTPDPAQRYSVLGKGSRQGVPQIHVANQKPPKNFNVFSTTQTSQSQLWNNNNNNNSLAGSGKRSLKGGDLYSEGISRERSKTMKTESSELEQYNVLSKIGQTSTAIPGDRSQSTGKHLRPTTNSNLSQMKSANIITTLNSNSKKNDQNQLNKVQQQQQQQQQQHPSTSSGYRVAI